MSPAFQRTLLDNKVLNKDIKPLADWQKFIGLAEIYRIKQKNVYL